MVLHKFALDHVCIGSGLFVFCMFLLISLVISHRRLSVSRPSVSLRSYARKSVGAVQYSLLVRILPHLQLACAVEDTDEIRF